MDSIGKSKGSTSPSTMGSGRLEMSDQKDAGHGDSCKRSREALEPLGAAHGESSPPQTEHQNLELRRSNVSRPRDSGYMSASSPCNPGNRLSDRPADTFMFYLHDEGLEEVEDEKTGLKTLAEHEMEEKDIFTFDEQEVFELVSSMEHELDLSIPEDDVPTEVSEEDEGASLASAVRAPSLPVVIPQRSQSTSSAGPVTVQSGLNASSPTRSMAIPRRHSHVDYWSGTPPRGYIQASGDHGGHDSTGFAHTASYSDLPVALAQTLSHTDLHGRHVGGHLGTLMTYLRERDSPFSMALGGMVSRSCTYHENLLQHAMVRQEWALRAAHQDVIHRGLTPFPGIERPHSEGHPQSEDQDVEGSNSAVAPHTLRSRTQSDPVAVLVRRRTMTELHFGRELRRISDEFHLHHSGSGSPEGGPPSRPRSRSQFHLEDGRPSSFPSSRMSRGWWQGVIQFMSPQQVTQHRHRQRQHSTPDSQQRAKPTGRDDHSPPAVR